MFRSLRPSHIGMKRPAPVGLLGRFSFHITVCVSLPTLITFRQLWASWMCQGVGS